MWALDAMELDMHRRIVFFLTVIIVTAACGIARADYVTNHVPGGHGPLMCTGATPAWGVVELWDNTFVHCERWLGDEAGAYSANPTAGLNWIRKSTAPNTYAVAYEHATYPYGNTQVVTSVWAQLSWHPALVTIQYDNPCPITPGEVIAHACTSDWTPMDAGGLLTYVIGNNIVKPGLPYGDYLHASDRDGPGGASWCTFNFSDYPGVTKPPGAPNHAVAVDACP